MILKQLRIARRLSQEQLADMSGLNVRTIQRIESGANASLESQKCIAAALDITLDVLNQESLMIDKQSDNWKCLPFFMKFWFTLNFLQVRPARRLALRVEFICLVFAVVFSTLGLWSEPAQVGGLFMLLTANLFSVLKWQGDKYQIWYEPLDCQEE